MICVEKSIVLGQTSNTVFGNGMMSAGFILLGLGQHRHRSWWQTAVLAADCPHTLSRTIGTASKDTTYCLRGLLSRARYWVIMQHETRSLVLSARWRQRDRAQRPLLWRSFSVRYGCESMSSPRTRVKGSTRKRVFDIMTAGGRTNPGWWLKWLNRAPEFHTLSIT